VKPELPVVVLDHTALLALGRGNRLLSRLIDAVHRDPDLHVYVPTLCLAAATAQRPALADHIGALPSVEMIDLGYASASAVGRLIADGVDWRLAQAVDTARPDPEWPGGRPVVAELPRQYAERGVDTIALS
jgi:hypothetical protein